jgi:ubiquinone/menaquinone biosynthesis C-methylase UbiE
MSGNMQIEHRTTVSAPPEDIFRIYEDVPAWHTWDPDTKSANLDGPLRVGSQGKLTPTKGNTVPMRVTAVIPDRSFTVASKIPLLRMVFEHELLPTQAGTEVIHRVTLSGLLALVIGPMLRKQLNKGLPVTLANLKRLAEASGAMSGSDPADDLHGYYAARAKEYDRVYAKPERQADLRQVERWLPGVFAGRAVLEVACGTGYWTRFVAPSAKRMSALDASAETLEIAKSRPENAAVQFIVGDAYRLPVAAQAFDAAFAGFWISHVPRNRVTEFLAELHRTLAPGSRVVLLDNRYVEGSSTAISETDAEGNTYQLRRLSDGSSHRVLKNFPSEDELRQALPARCSSVQYHRWPYYWAIEYVMDAD